MTGDFRKWVARLFQTKTAARAADRRTPRRAPAFRIESLEDRVVPAITILDATTGGSLDNDLLLDGTVNSDGTLSRGALTSVAAATNISVTAATGDITFNGFAATVTLLTGGGSTASFTAPGAIAFADPTDNFATSGGGLVFTAGGAATLASLSGGSLDAQAGGALAVTSATTTGAIDLTSTAANVSSTGTLQTPGQLTLVAATGIAVQTSAATLQANNSTSGDIVVTQTAAPSQLLTITNTAGGVVNSAPGGAVTLANVGSGIQIGASAPVQTAGGGAITLAAQDLIIDPSATVNAGTGTTTLTTSDPGREINLGGNGVTVGKLTLTQAELDRVTGTGVLRVGGITAGELEVNAPINANAPVARAALTLVAGPGGITSTGTGAVVATNLRLSGVGDVVLTNGAGNNVTNLVADVAGAADRFVRFDNGVDPLAVGANIDGVTGITLGGTDAFLILSADVMEVANPINVTAGTGGGRVTLVPDTSARPIDLGTETAGSLSLTAAELGRITAEGLVIGGIFGGSAITVTQPVVLTTVDVLDLSGGLITDTGAGSIRVDYLVAHSGAGVLLDAAANNVDRLSGLMVFNNNTSFEYRDADGFVIDTTNDAVGFFDGVRAGNTLTGIRVTLAAGGPITQTAGSVVVADSLQLLGAGPVTLTDPGNEVNTLAAGVTNGLTYVDATGLTVGTVNGTVGVTTTNSAVDISTVNGLLNVTQAVNAGSGTVVLTAGNDGTDDTDLTISGPVTGTGGVTLVGDNVFINTTVNAGSALAEIRSFQAGDAINLGGGDGTNTLGLQSGELNLITAGVIRIGSAAAGNITVTAAIAPTGTSQLELETGGAITNGGGSITETRLGLTAGAVIGAAGNPLDVSVSNLEAFTPGGGIFIDNTGTVLTIGGVNATLSGVRTNQNSITITNDDDIVIGATPTEGVSIAGVTGSITLAANGGTLTVDAEVTNAAPAGNVTLSAASNTAVNAAVSATGGGDISITTAQDNITINAPVAAGGGSGNVTLNAEDNVNLNSAVSAVGTGDITIIAEPTLGNAGNITSTAAGTVTAGSGDIRLEAADNVTLAGAVAVTAGTGTITVIAEPTTGISAAAGNFSNSGTGTLTTAGGDIHVQAGDDITVGAAISAGGAGDVTILADAAIDGIGNVTSSAPVSTMSGSISATGFNVTLNPGGTVTSTAGGDITLQAGLGGGGAATVGAAVTTSGGNGNVLVQASNNAVINAPVSAAGTGTITVFGDFGDNGAGNITTSAAGTLDTAGGAIIIGGLSPTLAQVVTLNGAVTVTGGGGDITVGADGTVTTTAPLSVTGTGGITIRADEDSNGSGDINTAALTTAGGSIALGVTFFPQVQNVFVNGATTVNGGSGDVSITAEDSVVINAPVSVTGTGNVFVGVIDGDILVAADVTTASGTITAIAGVGGSGNLFTNQADVTGGGGADIQVRADNMDLQAGSTITTTGVVTLRVVTGGVGIDLGSAAAGTGAIVLLSDAELDTITAGTRLVLVSAADVTVTDTITLDPTRVDTLLIQAVGGVVDGTAADVQDDLFVESLAIQSATGVGSADTLNIAVTNLAVTNSTTGNVFVSNHAFSVGGPLNITVVDGVTGVRNAGPGDIFIANFGGLMSVVEVVAGTAGGNVTLTNAGAGADIVIDDNGGVAATGGNGDVVIDSTGATSGGAITINSTVTVTGIEVQATFLGNIAITARDAVTFASSQVQSGNLFFGGDIAVSANVGVAGGGADITLTGPASIQTRGNVSLTTDPDFVLTGTAGADIVMSPQSVIKGNGNTLLDNKSLTVVLRADGDVIVSTVWADTDLGITAAENIVDDADVAGETFVQATDIQLIAGGLIGGAVQITPTDVFSGNTGTPSPAYRAALDFDLDNLGSLIVTTGAAVVLTGTGGNVQLRQVDDPLDLNPEPVRTQDLNVAGASINSDNQLAVISSAGDFLVDSAFVVPSNADVLLATTAGGSVVITGGVTNPGGMNADTVIVASGSPAASILGTVGGVADVVGPVVNLVTTGGTVGLSAAAPLEINATRLDGQTTGGGGPGGSAFITDTQNGVAVGRFDAGSGDVVLRSLGNNGTTANITAVTPNDNAAEIIANTVTLDATAAGPIAGPNGQIGLPGTFFEVNANVINAATNNSSLWISEVGTGGTAGATVGSVTAGTATAFLRVRNGGTLTSDDPGVPDVVAATVNLSTVAGDTPAGGNFGTSVAGPLEINAATLNSNLAGGGNLFVLDTAGGLTVQRANTTAGSVGIQTSAGGSLVLGNGSSTGSVVLATGTVTLTSGGSITSTAPGGVRDVTAPLLAVTAAAGIGTGTVPAGAIETAVSSLAFSNLAGAVNIANTGALTVTAVGALATSQNLGTTTTVSAASPLTFATTTATTGDTVYTAGETADAPTFADDLTINTGVVVSVAAGNLTLQAGDQINLNAGSVALASGTVTLNVGFNDLDGIGGAVVRGTIDSTAGTVAAVGGTGADTVLVDFTGGATLPDGLSFTGGSAADELQVSDAGSTATHAYTITAAGVVRDGGPAITFAADVESVDVTGGDLADAFTVTATAATAVDIHGAPPTTAAGDTLVVTNAAAAFLTTTGTTSVSGTYDFPAGTADVTFDNIESLNVGVDAVSVTKTDGITNATPGTTVFYTVVVTNNATVGLSNIRLQDVVPTAITGATFTAGFTGTGSTGNIGPVAGNNIDQTFSLAAGGMAIYTIFGTLDPTTSAGTGTLVNTVTVTPPAGVTDDPTNNTATDTDNVAPTGDVQVTKTNGVTSTVPGTTTTYTITVTNTGPSTATVTFADVFPAAITSATRTVSNSGGASGGTAGTGNINNTLTLPAGGTVTYTVQAVVSGTATGTLTNTASATVTTPGFDQGGATGNDSATDTDTLTPQGDVTVTKTNGTTTVTAGSTTTYTITVTNTGPSTVTVPFADTLPAQIVAATRTVNNAGGATGGTAGTGNIADTLTIPAGGTVTYTVAATIDPTAPAGTLTNTATATVPGGFDQGANAGPDSATDSDTLVAAPDLAVTAAAPATGKVGTPFTYTFTVTNGGSSTQTGVVLTHTLPAESINTTATSSQGSASIVGGVVTAAIGTIAPGATVTVTVTINPTDDGVFDLTATATGALPEPITANNTDTATTLVAPYQPLIVAGPGNGGGAEVRVLNADTGALEARFIPFGPFYTFAMSVAQGDVNGDGVPEIIVGAGPGGAARVVVYDVRTGAELRSFFAFEPTVTGGVNVGAGDLDGDGKDEILTGAGAGFGPRVRAFSGATGAEIRSFFAYETSFTGGVRVAAGDTNGDGRVDIITGAGGGGSARVQVFDGTTLAVLQNFFAYASGLREGVYVSAADVDGDGVAEIVTGAGGGGASHIKLFDGKSLAERASFFAFAPTARDGVTVGATDRGSDGRDDITAGTGVGVQAQVKEFTGAGAEEAVFNAFDIGFVNGVYVG